MSEAPASQCQRPGIVQVVITSVLTVLFATRTALWWAAVAAGRTAVADMTAWEWLRVGFYHVAMVVGVVALVEMFRERARPRNVEAGAAEKGAPDKGTPEEGAKKEAG